MYRQFGVGDYKKLDTSEMLNTNGSLVGPATVHMGNGKNVNNWAIYQLSLTKTGNISQQSDIKDEGIMDKRMYQLVDLQFGPDGAAGRDTRFADSWAGQNRQGAYTLFSLIFAIFMLMVLGRFAIYKIEVSISLALNFMLFPFMALIALLPGGPPKFRDYLGRMANLGVKRLASLLFMIITLKFLFAGTSISDNLSHFYIYGIVVLFAFRHLWKDYMVLLDTSAGAFGDSVGGKMMSGSPLSKGEVSQALQNSKFIPRSLKQKMQESKYTAEAFAGGAAAGSILAIQNQLRDKDKRLQKTTTVKKVATDEDGNVLRDKDGDIIYRTETVKSYATMADIIKKSAVETSGIASKRARNKSRREGLGLIQGIRNPILDMSEELAHEFTDGGRTADSIVYMKGYRTLKSDGIVFSKGELRENPKIQRLIREYSRNLEEMNLLLDKTPEDGEVLAKDALRVQELSDRLISLETILKQESDRLGGKIDTSSDKNNIFTRLVGKDENEQITVDYFVEYESTAKYKEEIKENYKETERLIRSAEASERRLAEAIARYKLDHAYIKDTDYNLIQENIDEAIKEGVIPPGSSATSIMGDVKPEDLAYQKFEISEREVAKNIEIQKNLLHIQKQANVEDMLVENDPEIMAISSNKPNDKTITDVIVSQKEEELNNTEEPIVFVRNKTKGKIHTKGSRMIKTAREEMDQMSGLEKEQNPWENEETPWDNRQNVRWIEDLGVDPETISTSKINQPNVLEKDYSAQVILQNLERDKIVNSQLEQSTSEITKEEKAAENLKKNEEMVENLEPSKDPKELTKKEEKKEVKNPFVKKDIRGQFEDTFGVQREEKPWENEEKLWEKDVRDSIINQEDKVETTQKYVAVEKSELKVETKLPNDLLKEGSIKVETQIPKPEPKVVPPVIKEVPTKETFDKVVDKSDEVETSRAQESSVEREPIKEEKTTTKENKIKDEKLGIKETLGATFREEENLWNKAEENEWNKKESLLEKKPEVKVQKDVLEKQLEVIHVENDEPILNTKDVARPVIPPKPEMKKKEVPIVGPYRKQEPKITKETKVEQLESKEEMKLPKAESLVHKEEAVNERETEKIERKSIKETFVIEDKKDDEPILKKTTAREELKPKSIKDEIGAKEKPWEKEDKKKIPIYQPKAETKASQESINSSINKEDVQREEDVPVKSVKDDIIVKTIYEKADREHLIDFTDDLLKGRKQKGTIYEETGKTFRAGKNFRTQTEIVKDLKEEDIVDPIAYFKKQKEERDYRTGSTSNIAKMSYETEDVEVEVYGNLKDLKATNSGSILKKMHDREKKILDKLYKPKD